MSTLSLRFAARLAALTAVLLPTGAAACGDRAQGTQARAAANTAADGSDELAERKPPAVDPCGLLTSDEIAEQLRRTGPSNERDIYATMQWDVKPTETPWGVSRRCEISYQGREKATGSDLTRGTFSVMVFWTDMMGIPEDRRKPVAGAPPEIFKHQQVYYVTKGDLAASLTDFRGTSSDGGDENSGRVALLRKIAARLP